MQAYQSEWLSAEDRAILTEDYANPSADPVLIQEKFNIVMQRMKKSYQTYVKSILFPAEAYYAGFFRVTIPSFNVHRSAMLYMRLYSKNHEYVCPWQNHWLSLDETAPYAMLFPRNENSQFSETSIFFNEVTDEAEKQRYVTAVHAFQSYQKVLAQYYDRFKQNHLTMQMDVSYESYNRIVIQEHNYDRLLTANLKLEASVIFNKFKNATLSAENRLMVDCLSRNEVIIYNNINIQQYVAFKQPDPELDLQLSIDRRDQWTSDLIAFYKMHRHNLGVIDAKMATHRALAQQERRQKLTRILYGIGLFGLLISGVGLGILYIAYANILSMTITQCLLPALAISAASYGCSLYRIFKPATINTPPLEIVGKPDFEEEMREIMLPSLVRT